MRGDNNMLPSNRMNTLSLGHMLFEKCPKSDKTTSSLLPMASPTTPRMALSILAVDVFVLLVLNATFSINSVLFIIHILLTIGIHSHLVIFVKPVLLNYPGAFLDVNITCCISGFYDFHKPIVPIGRRIKETSCISIT